MLLGCYVIVVCRRIVLNYSSAGCVLLGCYVIVVCRRIVLNMCFLAEVGKAKATAWLRGRYYAVPKTNGQAIIKLYMNMLNNILHEFSPPAG